jgi:hypothetical protein
MINNHIRTAAGTTLLAAGLGLAAVTLAIPANAAPVVDPPQAVCWETYSDGSYFYYYC